MDMNKFKKAAELEREILAYGCEIKCIDRLSPRDITLLSRIPVAAFDDFKMACKREFSSRIEELQAEFDAL